MTYILLGYTRICKFEDVCVCVFSKFFCHDVPSIDLFGPLKKKYEGGSGNTK